MNDQNSFSRKIDTWAYGTKSGDKGAIGTYDRNGRHVDRAVWHGINTAVTAVKETATGKVDYAGTKHQAKRCADHVKGVDPYKKQKTEKKWQITLCAVSS